MVWGKTHHHLRLVPEWNLHRCDLKASRKGYYVHAPGRIVFVTRQWLTLNRVKQKTFPIASAFCEWRKGVDFESVYGRGGVELTKLKPYLHLHEAQGGGRDGSGPRGSVGTSCWNCSGRNPIIAPRHQRNPCI